MKAKENSKKHKGVMSWFSVVLPWTKMFAANERVVWIDIEGLPSLAWTTFSFDKIEKRWGELLYVEDPNDTNVRKNITLGSVRKNKQ